MSRLRAIVLCALGLGLSPSQGIFGATVIELVNEPGFGSETNITIDCAVQWGRKFYVGVRNRGGTGADAGAKIYATTIGQKRWVRVSPNTNEWKRNRIPKAMAVFNRHLYVATDRNEVWRTDGLGTWENVSPPGTYSLQTGITAMAEHKGDLFVAFGDPVSVQRRVVVGRGTRTFEKWVTGMGSGDFKAEPGFGRTRDQSFTAVFGTWKGRLYMGIGRRNPGGDGALDSAVQVWQYAAGNWIPRTYDNEGFGDRGNGAIIDIQGLGDYIYVGTHNASGGGAQIWRARLDKEDWQEVTPRLWRGRDVVHAHAMAIMRDRMFVGTREGDNVGTIYESSNPGNRNSWSVLASIANNKLANSTQLISVLQSADNFVYAGTWDTLDGTHLYRMLPLFD